MAAAVRLSGAYSKPGFGKQYERKAGQNMAINPQFKINQVAKDLGKKSKDIVEILTESGFEVKNTQKVLEAKEFDVLFDKLTRAHQITEIENYLDGITYIPSKPKKEAAPAQAEKPAEVKPIEEKKAESAPKPTETEAKKAEKPEAPKETPKKEAAKPAEAPAKTEQPAQKSAPAPQRPAQPADKRPAPAQGGRPAPVREGGRPQQGGYQPRPQGAQGQGPRPQNQGQGGYQPRPQGQGQGGYQPRPQGQGQGGYQPRGGAQGGDRYATPSFGGRSDTRPQGQGQRPAQKGQGGFGGAPRRDKDEGFQSAPREKFQPQQIIREQTPKGGGTVTKPRGATRVVDMRGGSVDLSKYDEKLSSFVSDAVADMRGGNQHFKKKNPQQGMHGGPGGKGKKGKAAQPQKKVPVNVTIPDEISVGELASRLKVTAAEVIKKLMMMGMMATVNQFINYDTAYLIADELGANVTKEVVVTIEEKLFDEGEDTAETLVPRAPVVCVMGHVDHGKTSLLDAIRNTHVTTGEAGGITQHIGAYRVKIKGQDITFLDTPGHEAFTAMRARGAQATDIAILVVAADDGIMPQTIEAINHAKAAGIEIVVAINKMDKPTANPDAVKQELTKYKLVPEEWGGDVICVPVSALTHEGIDDLLESVLLVAEVKELKANPNRRAKGIVIEAKLDKGRGPVATVLIQNGTLRAGDIVIAGTAVGRVRAMTDHTGRTVKEAPPSVPVEIIGLAEVPVAGDEFNAVEDERMARELADNRREKAKEEEFKANSRASLNDLFNQISEGVKTLNIIVKADVIGSAEAVKQSLEKISNEEVRVKVIHSAAGGINEGDVMLAAASNAIIIGFNVRPDKGALDSAERQEVEIRTYRVIYDCIEEVKAAMKGMLAPKFKEVLLGHAEVRQTIHVPNVGTIAGSYIQDGKISRNAQIRVVRDGVVIFEDKISSLKRFKDDAREVAAGYECGVGLEKFNDIKIGDILEAFIMEEIEQ